MLSKDQIQELEEKIKPLLEWIKEHCPPDTTLIIDEKECQLVNKMFRVVKLNEKI